MITYKPLKKQLIDKELKITELGRMLNLSSSTVAKINANKYISLNTINSICKILNCDIENVIQYENRNAKTK